MICNVVLSRKADKQIDKIPDHISANLFSWVDDVKKNGLEEVRKWPSYHDEPLKGKRRGQRSIRLNRAYRAIYEIRKGSLIEFVKVKEVSKHEY